MNINELSLLILAVGISGSCIGISVAIVKLLAAVTGNVDDLRQTVRNLGILTDGLIEDQKLLREGLENFAGIARKIQEVTTLVSSRIVYPITAIFGFLSSAQETLEGVKSWFSKDVE